MKKVLVIEDDPQVRDNIQDILSLEDLCTVTATNGLEGLSLAKEEHPDIVICDIMLPKLNGYDVLTALRQNAETEAIPFIFLTAKADRTDLRHAMALGADDYLTKPFTPTELRQAIAIRLEKQAHLEEQTQRQLGELRQNIAYSLPHELNTPLVGIINGTQLLRHCYDPVEQSEAMELLDCVERSGKRLQMLIQNFVTYADLELLAANPHEVIALQREDEDCFVMSLIHDIALQKAEQFNREADLQIDVQDALLKISFSRFRKAIAEIIDNAFKFSSPGSTVRITSSLTDNLFHLFVIDRGRGIAAEQIAKVGAYMQFQRRIFEQHGVGLGLAIAKRTAELYGGELEIESFPGRQTIVRMTIPLACLAETVL